MKKINFLSLIFTLILVIALTIVSEQFKNPQGKIIGNYEKISFKKKINSFKDIKISIDFLAGKLAIFKNYNSNDLEFNALLKISELKPKIDFLAKQNLGRLNIWANQDLKPSLHSRSKWTMNLTTQNEYELQIKSKLANHYLNLSGIPLRNLNLITGTGKINLYFDEINPLEMNPLSIHFLVANLRLNGLLNARSKEIILTGKAGNLYLDFSGKLSANCSSTIDCKLARLKIFIPSKTNCRIIFKDNISISCTISGFTKIAEDTYVSKNYNPNQSLLDLKIKINSGSISIKNS